MSITTITFNTVDYDVYSSVAEADEYLQVDVARADNWDVLDTEDKQKAIITASRKLDKLNWQGSKSVSTQALAWPRDLVTPTPDEIFEAAALLAADIAQDPTIAEKTTSSNTKKVKAGSVEVEFFRAEDGTVLPMAIFDLIKQYLESGNSLTGIVASGVSGDNSSSCFLSTNPYGTVRGYR